MRHSRIDSPTLKAFGWFNLSFCAVSIVLGAIAASGITLVIGGACHWWASLEVTDE